MKFSKTKSLPENYRIIKISTMLLVILNILSAVVAAQDYERHMNIDGALIYDYDPSTKLGNDIFGTIIPDFSEPVNGQFRCS